MSSNFPDGMSEFYADLAAESGWNACAGCGIWGPASEMVEYNGHLFHDHCLPVDMFEAGAQVRVLGSGPVAVVTGHGQYAVFVRFPDGSTGGFLPRDLVRV